ncbi:hypothetical protein KY290_026429 [Solanum tuberosum]|uniref:Uncharacterized protein n=2 Tax=Solanum tuberosum TaxID=4113 RepID=A0ABQ7UY27_SOLTU|nr:PREDICTED: uncharacterized protein LOC107062687 [Solanum tuberosum]KAH0671734.1 hypothetical protein KY284_022821 [Solanum tuberosum]KAH0677473.1 hypothetical protein KY285_025274 [Solanum tuberosum]KAH0756159.1 hypothetical protein KY290_026429 [Solanum tuberosum]
MTSSVISSCSNLLNSSKSFETTPSVTKMPKRVVINARFDQYNRGGRSVDENMIVLRMRIKDMKLLETEKSGPPSNWMGWEKKYFSHYNEDVCEAIGLLQMYLMETRPALALGMLALICLSLSLSTYFLLQQVIEMAKFILQAKLT